MTSNPSPRPKSYTPPKAEPTWSQADRDREQRHLSARQVTLQWAAVIIVGLVIFGLAIAFGSGTGGGLRNAPIGGHG
jgi:hypothetical protein